MDPKVSVTNPGAEPGDEHRRSSHGDLRWFRGALESGRTAIWSWDAVSQLLTWSTCGEDAADALPEGADGTVVATERELRTMGGGVLADIRLALETRAPSRQDHRVASTPGQLEERWMEATVCPLVRDGVVAKLLGVCREITDRLRVEREVTARARQQEALARLGERALIETDLQPFFQDAVTTLSEVLDLDLVMLLELLPGDAELLLRAGTGLDPGLVGSAHVSTDRESQAGYTLAAGRPVIVEDLATETRFSGEPLLQGHGVVSGITAPIAGHAGRTYGVLGVYGCTRRKLHDYDAAFLSAVANVMAGAIERRQLDQRHELMIRELRHRSGNLFAQLLALFSQTAKRSGSVSELAVKYEARVLALANAHRLITEGGWRSTSLNELLSTLLAPFLVRVTLSGPNVLLEPDTTFGLSMAIHELATNASKHGSLSVPFGCVDIAWSVTRTRQGLTLIFDWKESRGPPPKRARRPGFGSRLINLVIERQLNGETVQSLRPEGLHAKLTVPLTHERWSAGTRNVAAITEP